MRNIGNYRLLEILGYGGMARVFKAMHLARGALVALKLLRPREMTVRLLGQAEIRRRFFDEARIMGMLRHPHIAAVHEAGEYAGHPFFVQEYLCFNLGMLIGESARVERLTRPLSPIKSARMISQTLDGLAALHDAGIVHRDIKPSNLMLTRQADVKIIDLGLSRREGSMQKQPPGMIIGSPYYAAPEQEADPETAGSRADLYSVGVVFYRLVTGKLPDHTRGYTDRGSHLGAEWAAFLKTALAPEPHKRFSSARAMKKATEELGRQWEKRRDQVCRLPESETTAVVVPAAFRTSLRSNPVRTGRKIPMASKGLNRLLQPVSHIENTFQKHDEGTLDLSTNLVWAASASDIPMDLEQAMDFVAALNRKRSARKPLPEWRLPTIDELVSLLRKRDSLETFCKPSMDQLKKVTWLWSADMQSRTKAWIVDLEQGAVMPLDRMCSIHVLPVRDSGNG